MKRGFTLRRAAAAVEDKDKDGDSAAPSFLRSPRKTSAPPSSAASAANEQPLLISSPRARAVPPLVCAPLPDCADTLPEIARAATETLTAPGGAPAQKYSRAAPAVDGLVGAASSLLRCLKTARGAVAAPEGLTELVAHSASLARQVAALISAPALLTQLSAVARRVPLLLERPSEAALSEALQEAVELAVTVRAVKDRAGEGAVLESGLLRLEAEMSLLGDCLNTASSGASVGPGVYEGLIASIGEMTKMLAHGKVASRPMLAVSFANVVESGADILRFGRLFLTARAESEAKMLQGKTMHVGVHVAALLRAKLLLIDEGEAGAGAAAAEAVLRAKMMETDSSVNSLTGAISYEPSASTSSSEVKSETPARSKGFTLYRKQAAPPSSDDSTASAAAGPAGPVVIPQAPAAADWLNSGYDARGTSGLLFCLAQLQGRLADVRSFVSTAIGGMESSIIVAVDTQSSLGVFPADVVAATVMRFLERHGPLFTASAANCARQMLGCTDLDQRALGLFFCILSLAEPRQRVLWALMDMCTSLMRLPASTWTGPLLGSIFEQSVIGGGDAHVFEAILTDPGRVQRAGAAHNDQFRMSSAAPVVGCAVLPFVADLMVREEYRLLEPRILEVVLMTHTVYCQSSELLRLLLELYGRHRGGGAFGKHTCNRVLDAVGFWFMSPLYLRPDHLNDEFIGTWQAFLQRTIASGIREAEKVTLKKFTQLLSANYARLVTQMSEKSARQAISASLPTPELDFVRKWLVLEPREIQLLSESMTRVDSTMFCDVQPFELFSNAHLDPTRAPGFARMTLQFNTIGTWVAHCLLAPDSKSSDRATMISVFVALAKALCDLNNFHGSYAVLCGLNSSAVSRLAKSWAKVNKRVQTTLAELMELNSHTKNYKVYREHMRLCRPPIIPQIGVISRDLFGLEENNVDMLEKRFVNLEKSRVLEKVAFEMLQLQATAHTFSGPPDETLVGFFNALPLAAVKITEKMLYERSLSLEKRAE